MLSKGQNAVGRLARQQYRNSSLLPQMYLSSGRDGIQETFRYHHLLERLSAQRSIALTRLQAATKAVHTLSLDAQRSQDRAQHWAAQQWAIKLAVDRELKRIQALTANLTDNQGQFV
ncbi:hypothetical protein [Streptomyces syringium]|uniref:hypothetical protein n=1 Tax=Streptomyces syringium TaxID=76729 RepID=UPI0033DEDCFD